MTLKIRPAIDADTSAMAEILNALIAEGSTTALATAVSAEDMKIRMHTHPDTSSWIVAEDPNLGVLGFQWAAPHPGLPPDACDIATFARMGHAGRGIGRNLFDATRKAAAKLRYKWINANIREDNQSGLGYYSRMGFQDYDRIENYHLDDGRIVNKILKRFDL